MIFLALWCWRRRSILLTEAKWLAFALLLSTSIIYAGTALAAPGNMTLNFSGYGNYTTTVQSNACADVLAGWDAYAIANAWSDRFSACSADPVVVGTTITATSGPATTVSIAATSSTPDPDENGLPTTVGPVDHITFAAGVLAIAFLLGLGAGWRS